MTRDHNEVLRQALSRLNAEVPPVPEDFHAGWMKRVEDDMEQKQHQKAQIRHRVTRWLSVAAAVVFVFGGTLLTRDKLAQVGMEQSAAQGGEGLFLPTAAANMVKTARGAAYDAGYGMEYGDVNGMAYTMTEESMDVDSLAMPQEAPTSGEAREKKIIRTAALTIVTQRYAEGLSTLRGLCEEAGGWVSASNESVNSATGLHTAYLTLRIPTAALDGYLEGSAGAGRVTRREETAEDVSENYYDTKARLENQQALMARLQALVTDAATLSDLLDLETKMADTQYAIDQLQTSLNRTDRQVDYATVNVTLREERTPELTDGTVSLGARLLGALRTGWEAFTGFLQDVAVFLTAALPFLAVVAVVAGGLLLRKRHKKS